LYDAAKVVPNPALLAQPTKLLTGAVEFTFRNTPGLGLSVLSTTNAALRLDNWASLGSAAEISPGIINSRMHQRTAHSAFIAFARPKGISKNSRAESAALLYSSAEAM
jgi:hypothetical protein